MSSLFQPKPKPDQKLARYRLLSPTASVRVSPLCFGAMNLGTAWAQFMGTMDKDTGFKMLDHFYDQGGNFIDTANNYQNEESEEWIGEWMAKRNNRSQIVLATKYTTNYKMGGVDGPACNFTGNSTKSLHESVKASLKKLQTDYIDLLWLHWWDYTTDVEEVMQGLDVLVKQGKILYLGVSDTPAWVVSKANQYARDHGMRQFCVYQGQWSASNRDMERDVIPMCINERMGLCPWGALGGGNYKTKEQIAAMEKSGDKGRASWRVTERDEKVTVVLDKLSKELGISITGVALAYVMQKTPYVFPIVGGRKTEHLDDNIKAIGVKLTPEQLKEIEESNPFELGFPHNFLGGSHPSGNPLLASAAYVDYVGMPGTIHDD